MARATNSAGWNNWIAGGRRRWGGDQATGLSERGGSPVRRVWSPAFLSSRAPDEEPSGRAAKRRRTEAVLFLAREPLTSRRMAQLAKLADGTEARTLVRELQSHYDRRGAAFQVVEIAGGFQLLTRGKFVNWLRQMHSGPAEVRLSTPALETLAVVAYRQPVLRTRIEAIRGVACGEILRQLMDRDLVRICGRADELGRPFLYGTTKHFLSLFGLKHVDDLPRAEELRRANGLAAGPVANASGPITLDDWNQRASSDPTKITETERENDVTSSASFPLELEEVLDPRPDQMIDGPVDDDDWEDEDEDDDDQDDDEDDWDDDDDEDFDDDDEWEEVDDDEELDDDDEDDEDDDDWDDEDDDDWDEAEDVV